MGVGVLKGLIVAANRPEDELAAIAGARTPHGLPVANKPILHYGLDAISAAGVEEVGVVVSGGTRDAIKGLLGDGRLFDVRLTYIEAKDVSGLVDVLTAAKGFLGDSGALVQLGDAIVTAPLSQFADEFRERSPDALLLLRATTEHERARTTGELDQRRLLHVVGQRPVPPAEQSLAGVYMLGPAAIEAAIAGGSGTVGSAMAELVDREGTLETRIVDNCWKYAGTVDDLLEANRMVLDEIRSDFADVDISSARIEGRVMIHPTAVLDRARVRGPAVIGPGAVLLDTFVGPYSAIGAGVRLEGAELEHSIVLDGAVIRHIGRRLEASLVGRDATVTRDFEMPSALRVRVGTRAEVSLA